MLAAGRPPGQP